MRLQPLPVPTRVYGGEGVVSYSHRHAARNHSQPGEIETGLRERGIRLRKAHSAAERVDVWRQLGNLYQSAFTAPTKMNGDPVTDRRLCLRCTQGNPAIGRLPHVGLICLRHKRWIGSSPQVDLHAYVAALTAERHFRNHLAARGVLFDSFAMELGRACANPVFIGIQEIERRRQQTDIETSPRWSTQNRSSSPGCSPAPRFWSTSPTPRAKHVTAVRESRAKQRKSFLCGTIRSPGA
jgi:hypothetical protein